MYMAIAVAICILLTTFNLFLLLGVIKRLRDQSERLAGLDSHGQPPEPMLTAGARPGPFTARTIDDAQVSEAMFASGGLIGFFSPTCDSCAEWMPRFAAAAAALPGGRHEALAVVVAPTPADGAEFVDALRATASVVVEEAGGPVAASFGVKGYPAIARMASHGVVLSNEPADVVAVSAVR
jgi:hypothetical protein